MISMIMMHSKEIYKVEVDFSRFKLERLTSFEVFGLYLIGEISFEVLKDVLHLSDEEARKLVGQVCQMIEDTSKKDDSQVEYDIP
jgi:hypothetical protein